MRMRRKKNLEQRTEACAQRLIYLMPQVLDDRLDDPSAEMLRLGELFGTERAEADIGCGKGAFACECAKLDSRTGILAVESLHNVIIAGCERAVEEELDNIRFVCVGAQYLRRYIPERSLSRIYLNFSCPYPKSGHESKRLTSKHFLDIYKELLTPDGGIWQKTDNREFFEYSLEQYERCGFELRNVTFDLHASDNSLLDAKALIRTEYEQRFIGRSVPICRVEAYLRH